MFLIVSLQINGFGAPVRQNRLVEVTLWFFFITLLSLELVWFGFLSYGWVFVLWLGSCLMVGFLSCGWVLVLWFGSCLMICLMFSISLNV